MKYEQKRTKEKRSNDSITLLVQVMVGKVKGGKKRNGLKQS
jgi:hypothetical protein